MTFLSSSSRISTPSSQADEQILYDYLLERIRQDSPEQMLEHFRHLFIKGAGFRHTHVFAALEKIARDRHAEQKFNYILNRCCHILINHWQVQPQTQFAIPELVGMLENLAPARRDYPTTANRIRQLVKNFTDSDQYIKMQRLARVISSKKAGNSPSVGSLIHRYPYLYNYCLLSDDSSTEDQQTVRKIKAETERRFEVELSRYVTYKVRLAEMMRSPQVQAGESRIIRPVINPTLLSDRELNHALKHYLSSSQDAPGYKNLSHSFTSQIAKTPTFQDFKDDLYEYLMTSIDIGEKRQFHRNLYSFLQNTLPECNQQRPTEFLLLRTSSHLLNYLVVESSQKPEHYVFIDMIANMGVTRTMGMLLKIALMCRKVKPYLEKRLSILFNHYESFTREGVPWLVKTLENAQLAFSIYFGKADLSCLKQVKL